MSNSNYSVTDVDELILSRRGIRAPKNDLDLYFDPYTLGTEEEDGPSGLVSDADKHPVDLTFKDVKYEVDVGKGKNKTAKQILKGISGEARHGHVLAIMGASGAGKTTLLNILAGRLSQAGNGRTAGSILVNGQKRDYKNFRNASAYVLQQDYFFADLTVEETITLSALLRLPQSMPKEAKMKRITQVIDELGLGKVKNTKVGNELVRGVSGGERKRVNIAVELVNDPGLIFLDEPTTGLDSFNSQNVMSSLLELARSGRTVIATIHQPRSSIFNMFDNLMLLSEGNCLYFGPAKEAVSYFSQFNYKCPSTFNPSDYFLDLISVDYRTAEATSKSQKRIQYLVDKYDKFRQETPIEYSDVTGGIQNVFGEHGAGSRSGKYATGFLTQLKLLTQRALKAIARERATNFARLGQTLIFALILGFIWLQEGGDESGSVITSTAGALFFVVVNQSFGAMFGVIFTFPAERSIILKERAARSYHVGSYFWSKTLAEIPLTFFFTLLFVSISYWMIGLRAGAEHFFLAICIIFLGTLAAEGLALAVSALAKDPQQAGAIAPGFVVISMLFGGFFIGTDAIPVWLSWLKYVSFIKYAFAALMQNEYSDRVLDTSVCAGVNSTSSEFCAPNGDIVLDFFELEELSMASNIFVLLGLAVGFRLLSFLILRWNGPVYDHSI